MGNSFPKRETVDFFDQKIVRGSLVLFVKKRDTTKGAMSAGIFLHENRSSYTVAVRNGNTIHASNVFLLKDPVYYLEKKSVREALEAVEILRGNKLPKTFDANIAWGTTED